MVGLLALLFIVVPIVELYVVVQVAQQLGLLPTVALVLAVSAAGGWLCKREGIGLYRRISDEVARGQVPGVSLVDGFLVLLGGALLLTPGFVTDAVGLSLLLPPVRMAVRAVLVRRFARRARQAVLDGTVAGSWGGGRARVFVYDGRVTGGTGDAAGGRGRVVDVGEAVIDRTADRGTDGATGGSLGPGR